MPRELCCIYIPLLLRPSHPVTSYVSQSSKYNLGPKSNGRISKHFTISLPNVYMRSFYSAVILLYHFTFMK